MSPDRAGGGRWRARRWVHQGTRQRRGAAPARGSPACEPWCGCGRRAGMASEP